ncbi:unnamed protein product, partial [Musa acuminata subsp. burmannicoides]
LSSPCPSCLSSTTMIQRRHKRERQNSQYRMGATQLKAVLGWPLNTYGKQEDEEELTTLLS